jgi:hypothetical protein
MTSSTSTTKTTLDPHVSNGLLRFTPVFLLMVVLDCCVLGVCCVLLPGFVSSGKRTSARPPHPGQSTVRPSGKSSHVSNVVCVMSDDLLNQTRASSASILTASRHRHTTQSLNQNDNGRFVLLHIITFQLGTVR